MSWRRWTRWRGSRGAVQDVMLRLSPGVDPHTHVHTTTGILDSKFGFSVETGHAELAIRQALAAPNLDLVGVHFHLGSPIFELEPYSIAIDTVLTFVSQFRDDGLELREFSPGGGFAIGYVREEPPPAVADYAQVIASATRERCADLSLGTPRLVVEPGRSIVGRAGVALYSVGGTKDIPTVRRYVSLDGGMGDNIRPALYEARYEAVLASRMNDAPADTVTLVGKYCESGDVLIRDIEMPTLVEGDVVAIPSSGAYAPPMSSNYNMNPRPAIVMVKDGEARLIRRRETFEDMMRTEVFLSRRRTTWPAAIALWQPGCCSPPTPPGGSPRRSSAALATPCLSWTSARTTARWWPVANTGGSYLQSFST